MTCLQGQTIDDIPSAVLDDACQLVKANSIMGNKMNDIDIVYTMWANLKKTASMEVIFLFQYYIVLLSIKCYCLFAFHLIQLGLFRLGK